MTDVRLIKASANALPLDDESVQTCVCSPPYWGLRQYAGEQEQAWGGDPHHEHEWGPEQTKIVAVADKREKEHASDRDRMMDGVRASQGSFCVCGAWYGALGLEPTPELYVAHMVEVFREVKRVLRPDGTLWMNLGDSYNTQPAGNKTPSGFSQTRPSRVKHGIGDETVDVPRPKSIAGLKPKDLVGIPWMVAFALRADGWYLRSDIIWHKPNPMPESVTDRPTKAHEYLFLLSKSERYFYDADAIKEVSVSAGESRGGGKKVSGDAYAGGVLPMQHLSNYGETPPERNKRSVWTVATRPYSGAHFATYPEDLIEPCILAGSSPKACGVCGAPWERVTERTPATVMAPNSGYGDGAGRNDGRRSMLVGASSTTTGWQPTCEHNDDSGYSTVLDPFNGSGTTGVVAVRHNRNYVGVDISDEYLDLARERINGIQRGLPWEAA